jgi:hypothetical protein
MPLEKEVPLFTSPTVTAGDLTEFVAKYAAGEAWQLRGKATPQYMGDVTVPQRIATLMPGCKLIAVLRDPLERTRSHYRMAQRRGTETRSFAAAVEPLLEPAAQAAARRGTPPAHRDGYESEAPYYLAWSEYGRILREYRRHFPAAQLLVLHSEELQDDPRAVFDRVLDFLGLDTDFTPRGLGEVMHAGGDGNRIPHGARVWLRERHLVRALWRCVPDQHQGRLRFLYERWNTRHTREALPLPGDLEVRLRAHFAADLALLRELAIGEPPWAPQYDGAGAPRDTGVETRCAAACA